MERPRGENMMRPSGKDAIRTNNKNKYHFAKHTDLIACTRYVRARAKLRYMFHIRILACVVSCIFFFFSFGIFIHVRQNIKRKKKKSEKHCGTNSI